MPLARFPTTRWRRWALPVCKRCRMSRAPRSVAWALVQALPRRMALFRCMGWEQALRAPIWRWATMSRAVQSPPSASAASLKRLMRHVPWRRCAAWSPLPTPRPLPVAGKCPDLFGWDGLWNVVLEQRPRLSGVGRCHFLGGNAEKNENRHDAELSRHAGVWFWKWRRSASCLPGESGGNAETNQIHVGVL